MPAAFVFNNPHYGGKHQRGIVRCKACTHDFPHLCRAAGCSGLMHAHTDLERGEETILTSRCDICGEHLVAA
jgi:hypothetical protein